MTLFVTRPAPDFRALFEKSPVPQILIDAAFRIVAVSDAHAAMTLTPRELSIGRNLFEVFPDNPAEYRPDGLSALRASLLKVLATKEPDTLPLLRYDVARRQEAGAVYERRFWRVTNTPIVGDDGFVACILNTVQDVTASVSDSCAARSGKSIPP